MIPQAGGGGGCCGGGSVCDGCLCGLFCVMCHSLDLLAGAALLPALSEAAPVLAGQCGGGKDCEGAAPWTAMCACLCGGVIPSRPT